MHIQSIAIREFRNLSQLDIQLAQRINFFSGFNGQGKTNVLEAIYVALRGQSFRTSRISDLIRITDFKSQLTRINLKVNSENGPENSINLVILEKKRLVHLNEKPVSGVKLAELFPLILFTPDSLSAIKSGPEHRRELLDEMAILYNPQIYQTIHEYQKILKARNRLLRNYAQDSRVVRNFELLSSLSDKLMEFSLTIIGSRCEIIREIRPIFKKTLSNILNSPQIHSDLHYVMSDEIITNFSKEEISQKLLLRRHQLFDAELASGTTLWGPHKHDLEVTYGSKNARNFCSQGQQRALILAIKISQIVHHQNRYGKYPVLLLDDVFSELDSERRKYLIHFLSTLETQSILTCTDELDLNLGLRSSVFEVSDGRVLSDRRGEFVKPECDTGISRTL